MRALWTTYSVRYQYSKSRGLWSCRCGFHKSAPGLLLRPLPAPPQAPLLPAVLQPTLLSPWAGLLPQGKASPHSAPPRPGSQTPQKHNVQNRTHVSHQTCTSTPTFPRQAGDSLVLPGLSHPAPAPDRSCVRFTPVASVPEQLLVYCTCSVCVGCPGWGQQMFVNVHQQHPQPWPHIASPCQLSFCVLSSLSASASPAIHRIKQHDTLLFNLNLQKQ